MSSKNLKILKHPGTGGFWHSEEHINEIIEIDIRDDRVLKMGNLSL